MRALLWTICLALFACGEGEIALGPGVPSGADQCPDDPTKFAPGDCGCGVAEIDSDADGTPDCIDGCPADPAKLEPGACGCGAADDAQGDAVLDCESGCADGEREGFNLPLFVDIAGCGGGWSVPGVTSEESFATACERQGGDDGPRPRGLGCGVEDLCAEGWHVCETSAEIGASLPAGSSCDDATRDGDPPALFISHVVAGSFVRCGGSNTGREIIGCGTFGVPVPEDSACEPINRWSGLGCGALPAPWVCGDAPTTSRDADVVTKDAPGGGGVMCCREDR